MVRREGSDNALGPQNNRINVMPSEVSLADQFMKSDSINAIFVIQTGRKPLSTHSQNESPNAKQASTDISSAHVQMARLDGELSSEAVAGAAWSATINKDIVQK